jgi:hypothetical protein
VEIRYWKEEQQIGSANNQRNWRRPPYLPLAEVEADSVVEQVDLLDFPGIAGVLKLPHWKRPVERA